MPIQILYHDTPAHFGPIFSAATPSCTHHIDAYVTDKDPKEGKVVRLGIRSWQAPHHLVAAITQLPNAYSPDQSCTRVWFATEWSHRREMQNVLFAESTLQATFQKYCLLASKVTPTKSGWRCVPIAKELFAHVSTQPANRVYNPFIEPRREWEPIQSWTALLAAARLAGGGYTDLREHHPLGADTTPDTFLVVRALIEDTPAIITERSGRVVFSTNTFAGSMFSFAPIIDSEVAMAAPAPATARAVLFK